MNPAPVMCFSHVRWNGTVERASQLMARCAQRHRVFFVEEPVIDATYTEVTRVSRNVWRVVPHLAEGHQEQELLALWREQLQLLRAEHRIDRPILWFYTPSAVPIARAIPRSLTVYDCTLDLAAHTGVAPELLAWERELMRHADVMFTAGPALYAQRRGRHRNLHLVPDAFDAALFGRARGPCPLPPELVELAGPCIGYYGAVDERLDRTLLASLADLRPDWHFVLVGSLAESVRSALPRRDNLHYLGPRPLRELPAYLADWDACMLPFACDAPGHASNARKVLECLAAGKPLVATPVPDVVEPCGRLGLIRLAEDAPGFAAALSAEVAGEHVASAQQRDAFLAQTSWDASFRRMYDVLSLALARRAAREAIAQARRGVQPAQH